MLSFLCKQVFALAILGSAAVSFSFPAYFREWGGVKPTDPVMPIVGFSLAKAFGFTGELAAGCVLKSAVAALPANVFSIWMNFSGSVLANWWSRRPVKS